MVRVATVIAVGACVVSTTLFEAVASPFTVPVLANQTPAALPAPPLDALLARAGDYATDCVRRFSGVVAEERYVQEVTRLSMTRLSFLATGGVSSADNFQQFFPEPPLRRELKSRFRLVPTEAALGSRAEREVVEADGRAIGARSGDAANDGGEFAFGGVLHNPLAALALLQPPHQSRFRMTLRSRAPEMGVNVWIVDYRERARPTIFRGPDGRDLEASGHFWIEWDTGRLMKTDLLIGSTDRIVTSFRFDEALRMSVPVDMHDWYSALTAENNRVIAGSAPGSIAVSGSGDVMGTATYERFRRLEGSTEKVR